MQAFIHRQLSGGFFAAISARLHRYFLLFCTCALIAHLEE
jgi:hypothetical protein